MTMKIVGSMAAFALIVAGSAATPFSVGKAQAAPVSVADSAVTYAKKKKKKKKVVVIRPPDNDVSGM